MPAQYGGKSIFLRDGGSEIVGRVVLVLSRALYVSLQTLEQYFVSMLHSKQE